VGGNCPREIKNDEVNVTPLARENSETLATGEHGSDNDYLETALLNNFT